MLTLQTNRLQLRQLCEADFETYAAWCADAEVMRYIGDGQPLARPMAWRSLATMLGHWQLRGYGVWGVEERATGMLVGRVGCWNPEGWPGFEVGWLVGREHWGRGFATEAGRAAMQFAFTQLQQPHVISLIHPENAASIRVAQRLGEQLAGTTELMGKPALIYRISREDWESANGKSSGPGGPI